VDVIGHDAIHPPGLRTDGGYVGQITIFKAFPTKVVIPLRKRLPYPSDTTVLVTLITIPDAVGSGQRTYSVVTPSGSITFS